MKPNQNIAILLAGIALLLNVLFPPRLELNGAHREVQRGWINLDRGSVDDYVSDGKGAGKYVKSEVYVQIDLTRLVVWSFIILALMLIAIGFISDLDDKNKKSQNKPSKQNTPDEAIDPDAEPLEPSGQSWNPILGANQFAAGEGLNPADKKRPDKT